MHPLPLIPLNANILFSDEKVCIASRHDLPDEIGGDSGIHFAVSVLDHGVDICYSRRPLQLSLDV